MTQHPPAPPALPTETTQFDETPHFDMATGVQSRAGTFAPPAPSWRHWLIGRPLNTADAPHQTIGKRIGLAVFASDALSSVAYGPQEMMLILAAAGMAALGYALPLAFVVLGLLVILTLSYEQTIHAYPGGGGAYIVSRDNLGELPAQIAAAALLTDYILTVSVSISSGVAQIVSAFSALNPWKVPIAVGLVALIMLINLRGVKESGITFAVPTYAFLALMYLTVGVGLFRFVTGGLGRLPVEEAHALHEFAGTLQPVTIFLILRAFSNGTTALTGVEAISNGITAFKEPRSHNAGLTLIAMSIILGSLLVSITFLAVHIGAVPSEHETVISQLARVVLGGRGPLYLVVLASTTLILVMAANTAFADFPRLSALVASDGFLPRQLTWRGSRLVYSRGIVVLAVIASLLIVVFRASVTLLLPLYAIGVFLSFTLSQAGMARRWRKIGHLAPGDQVREAGSVLHHDPGWRWKMAVNSLGAVSTAVVMLIFAVTKFTEGAYIILILIPILVAMFFAIHRHYRSLAKSLSLDAYGPPPNVKRHRVILPISGVHRGSLVALDYARALSPDVTAVHVSVEPTESDRVRQKWERWGNGVRLVILHSPYRLMLEPLLAYIQDVAGQMQANEVLTIVVPQFVPKHWWTNLLHTQTAVLLRLALLFQSGVVVTDVPYKVE